MWHKVRPFLVAARLDPVRVENPIHPGTPDVNLADGCWLELKCIEGWPLRATSTVRIPHFTPQQRVWLYRRWKYAPGSTFLLLEVCSVQQWLLFDGDVATKIVGRSTMSKHRDSARVILGGSDLEALPKVFMEIRRGFCGAGAEGARGVGDGVAPPDDSSSVGDLRDGDAQDRASYGGGSRVGSPQCTVRGAGNPTRGPRDA